jgi:hypothetical protein
MVTCSIINSFTPSIIPCLALRGIAGGIARSPTLRTKVLLRESSFLVYEDSCLNKLPVNSENDRETEGYTASDYIRFGLPISRRLN